MFVEHSIQCTSWITVTRAEAAAKWVDENEEGEAHDGDQLDEETEMDEEVQAHEDGDWDIGSIVPPSSCSTVRKCCLVTIYIIAR